MEQRRLLVTGASGALGYTVASALRARAHFVRGFDRFPARGEGEHVMGDLLDPGALGAATEGVDTVLHFAAVPDRQDFVSELTPNNIVGTHYALEAARLAGVRRFIYASSIRVVGGLGWEQGTIGLDAGLVPGDHYGVSKAAGELLARMYAERFGMSVLSARLGWFVRNVDEAKLFETLSLAPRIYLSHRDAERFFCLAVEAIDRVHAGTGAAGGYAAVFVTSHNSGDFAFDLQPARDLCGFEPRDTWPEGSTWSEQLRFESPARGPSLRPGREE